MSKLLPKVFSEVVSFVVFCHRSSRSRLFPSRSFPGRFYPNTSEFYPNRLSPGIIQVSQTHQDKNEIPNSGAGAKPGGAGDAGARSTLHTT